MILWVTPIKVGGKKSPKDSEEIKNPFPKSSQPPLGPPDDSSDSGEDSKTNKPPKIPPHSSKWPTDDTLAAKSRSRNYHFDLKFKLSWYHNEMETQMF
jgi:hypothetical protein